MAAQLRRSSRRISRPNFAINDAINNGQNFIQRLPDELLREMFLLYAEEARPFPLLYVCKRWNHIANNTGSLWSFICFASEDLLGRIGSEGKILDNPQFHCYTSLDSVSRAIRRCGSAKFRFLCFLNGTLPQDEESWKCLDPVWFSERCTVLWIILTVDWSYYPLPFRHLHALEETALWSENLQDVEIYFRDVDEHSKRLSVAYFEHDVLSIARNFPNLLSRLKQAVLPLDDRPIDFTSELLSHMANIEDLQLMVNLAHSDTLRIPSQKLRELSLRGGFITSLQLSTPNSLTALSIFNNGSSPELPPARTIEFLNLRELVIEDVWYDVACVVAPKLDFLKLRTTSHSERSMLLEALEHTVLRPRVLHIDKCVPETRLLPLFKGTWSRLEELQVTYVTPGQSLGETLTRALYGGVKSNSILPDLWCLRVLVVQHQRHRQTGLENALQEKMRRIVERRKEHSAPLRRVLYGLVSDSGLPCEDLSPCDWPDQRWIEVDTDGGALGQSHV